MPSRQLIWGVLTVSACLVPVAWMVDSGLRRAPREAVWSLLQSEGRPLVEAFQGLWPNPGSLDRICRGRGATLRQLRLESGLDACPWEDWRGERRIVADSMLRRALAGEEVRGQVVHSFAGRNAPRETVMTAIPVRSRGRVVAALLLGTDFEQPEEITSWILFVFWLAGAGLVAAWLGVGWWVRHTGLRRQKNLENVFLAWRNGELSRRLPESGHPGDGGQSALNGVIDHLETRLENLSHRLNEREAVLSSMVEGVIAVDSEGRLIELNRAAADLFSTDLDEGRGRPLLESVRNPELVRFVNETLGSPKAVEGELVLYGPLPRYLQAHGTRLLDAQGLHLGALIVLNDVTRLRRLEGLRREFVANVSHELKTPTTAIQGFVETLQEGGIENKEEARRFLGIISRQTERLNGIIEDLLSLSRIEQEAEAGTLQTENAELLATIQSAVNHCSERAQGDGVNFTVDVPQDVRVNMNPRLVEQAVVNLTDNAVKYGGKNKLVEVSARVVGGRTEIRVKDHGPGISQEHHSRLFERFYRVDKARSRILGGTGLGLAIVKHIAQAHGGGVAVESRPGEGSTFTIHFPADR